MVWVASTLSTHLLTLTGCRPSWQQVTLVSCDTDAVIRLCGARATVAALFIFGDCVDKGSGGQVDDVAEVQQREAAIQLWRRPGPVS